MHEAFRRRCFLHWMEVSEAHEGTERGIQLPGDWEYLSAHDLHNELNTVFKKYNDEPDARSLYVIVLLSKSIELYAAVKRLGDITRQIPTICCTLLKFQKCDAGIDSYLARKANFKCGGKATSLGMSTISGFSKDFSPDEAYFSTFFCLVQIPDVTHPSIGSSVGTPSAAAVVASLDENFMTFNGSIRLQRCRTEVCCQHAVC